jgi:Ser/Thr protein kinase RdoA (MazF antagonist)
MARHRCAGDRRPPEPEVLAGIAGSFDIPAAIDAVAPLGRGLINDTFRVDAGGRGYVLQRINAAIFPDPARIMSNLRALDRHARRQAALGLRIPALIPTREGDAALTDSLGAVWRLMELIEDAETLSRLESPEQARAVGALLGRFHSLVQSLSVETLGISLPGFHDTPAYLANFIATLSSVDEGCLGAEAEDCIRFVLARRRLAVRLADAQAQGRIPLRITHGDPKLDNILFGRSAGTACALIDLDTVQPGLILHDVGDCLRSCCNRSGESPDGRTEVAFDLAIAEPILRAYAEETRDWLSEDEIALMAEAIRLMPFELGMRFLTDHLEGNRYFKISEPGENLYKAGVQFALVRDIERKTSTIRRLVDASFGTSALLGRRGARPIA